TEASGGGEDRAEQQRRERGDPERNGREARHLRRVRRSRQAQDLTNKPLRVRKGSGSSEQRSRKDQDPSRPRTGPGGSRRAPRLEGSRSYSVLSRYPTPGSVVRWRGRAASSSSLWRSWAM